MESKPLLALLVVAVIAVVGYMVYKIGFDGYTVRPEQIFAETFTDLPTQIEDLTGGGTKSGSYDVWLKFKTPGRMAVLKNKDDFKKDDADQELARRWFAEHLTKPPVKSLENSQDWKFFKCVKSETQSISQEWLMYNWKTDENLYRKWGY